MVWWIRRFLQHLMSAQMMWFIQGFLHINQLRERSLLRVRLRLGFLVSLQLTFHGSDHHMEFWSAVTIQEFWSAVSGQITY
ncbi:hypothetical protein HanXRQr2_Chr17g0793191 [Helianthus annuus]|uniref:Uncharacterized protein n=1 Tax=Helianthus annuus TaxID=4232 RepID=A0A9K3DI84_HELAN|nr:hypothetical protein HanXRQr2_Chr17g0793191 [Helianthus annuus]KAJ0428470.1 hypothetical protein HanHA300_Chr17g0646481 [Helianthus annuus]KAJ0432564.1 hypothetical protein HanIR_Chr17g0860611 [Helianthus annuus]KAJ0446810.1 hypothetical protein HanHA89_Chr17g0698381 [Helianthus annuus]KAJ0631703.1 hypothetical protein HanLR1_Chr17g0656921 [Helianthus annuus]